MSDTPKDAGMDAGLPRAERKQRLLDRLAVSHLFAAPQDLVDADFAAIWRHLERLKQDGQLDPEDQGASDAALQVKYRAIAERRVRLGLLLSAIGRKNAVDVTDHDLGQAIQREVDTHPGQEQAVREYFAASPEAMAALRAAVFEDKVVDLLLAQGDAAGGAVNLEEIAADAANSALFATGKMVDIAVMASRVAAAGMTRQVAAEIEAMDLAQVSEVQPLVAIADAARAANFLGLAGRCYARARVLAPAVPEIRFMEAEVAQLQGRTAEARGMFSDLAASGAPPAMREIARLKAACILPPVTPSAQSIPADRARIAAALAQGPGLTVLDAWLASGFPNFYLAYQAEDDRPLQEALARYYLRFCPALGFEAPHVRTPRAGGRIRIGFVSSHFHGHTISYLNEGLIKGLDRDRFELTLFRIASGAASDAKTAEFAAAHPIVDLPEDLASAHQLIAARQMDVLHYFDIGMEYFGYFLAFARLARVQTVGWGHPVTTGIPNLDAFLSVDAMEPAGGEAHYSERLVRFSARVPDVTRPRAPVAADRAAFGLDPAAPVYLCPQSLFKVHPSFDAVVERILARDPAAVIHFLSNGEPSNSVFRERLGNAAARVRLLPRVPSERYLELLACADVILDVPAWSGGKTSLEAFACGAPVVHRPGRFMRGRHTLAFYEQMGLGHYATADDDAYAALAVRLARDAAFNRQMRGDIAARAARLFNQSAAVRENESWWLGALDAG